ncbi:MAG: LytTR family DNA-binding domain-containing protein [Lachnospiraceae bacterium]|nr:LytTR family DNA-binding domain-containing protein [Lachnospiraceae bacterium]
MNIAICDDNPSCIDELESRIKNYFSEGSRHADRYHAARYHADRYYADICPAENFVLHAFRSAFTLLESFSALKYDIVFLDIDMPGMTGMELAARIRRIDPLVQIVFVTYMEDQLPYGYRFKASGFVIKPYTQARINSVIDETMQWIKAGRMPIEIKLKGGGTTHLETREIMFIESYRHYVEAVKKDESRLEFLGKISSLETMLQEHNFARSHRSYLVNLAYVFIRNADSVRLTCGQVLPIGRSYLKSFKSLYEKYRKENG